MPGIPENHELGLPENATSEERVAKMNELGLFRGLVVSTGKKSDTTSDNITKINTNRTND